MAQTIAYKLDLHDRIECHSRSPAFITLKDHKDNFVNPKCQLLNPAKTQIDKVSKIELDKINKIIRASSAMNQWRNTSSVIKWFQNLPEKNKSTIIIFDIIDFYSSITEKLLKNAISFAKNFTAFSDDKIKTILNARKSLLFNSNEPWMKKTAENFDVAMGSFNGAEICELVGLFLLDRLASVLGRENVGLY